MEALRPFTLDDAYAVADLETARTPDSPIAGATMAYWWTHPDDGMKSMRWVAGRGGAINVFVEASHDAWAEGERRFGRVQASIHPDDWTEAGYREGIATAETWLRAESAVVAVATVREDFHRELSVLAELGYAEERRERYWELDLVERQSELLAMTEKTRAEMRRQGVELLTLDRSDDAETLQKVYELDVAATKDVPTTVPIRMSGFETWYRQYFENPGVRKDTFWIARLDGEVVGMSLIEFPPERGVPSTWFTGVSARHRGLGIARALKYETVAQAIALGKTRIRTDNDSNNLPILHLNEEMGYKPLRPEIELHREL
jgi:ribosomal protein S18 acetylase RimI-like enzyme